MEIVELAALLHDIGDYKYTKNSSPEEKIAEEFLESEGVDEFKKAKILSIIKGMGFKEEIEGHGDSKKHRDVEFGVVQDADRLDAIGCDRDRAMFYFWGKGWKRRAERRHKFMEDFLQEFYEEWDGRA
ncbi:metal-dependent phosphohydrolase [Actinidia rufa]|uniref:Metal-dependent phosphohydrolase n=1 Tax=Actinidia rufa TaxID=165716 RepID=A0A7J0F7P6_9ERIC|nr:metal-dependent phosphohydrolase [Actinidia rufa]